MSNTTTATELHVHPTHEALRAANDRALAAPECGDPLRMRARLDATAKAARYFERERLRGMLAEYEAKVAAGTATMTALEFARALLLCDY